MPKKENIALAAVLAVCYALPVKTVQDGCGASAYLLYQLSHANIWHLAGNMWGALLIPFGWNSLALSYLISALTALACTGAHPVAGFSAVLYALLGMHSHRWTPAMFAWLAVSAVAGLWMHMAVALHLAAFAAGWVVEQLYTMMNR